MVAVVVVVAAVEVVVAPLRGLVDTRRARRGRTLLLLLLLLLLLRVPVTMAVVVVKWSLVNCPCLLGCPCGGRGRRPVPSLTGPPPSFVVSILPVRFRKKRGEEWRMWG